MININLFVCYCTLYTLGSLEIIFATFSICLDLVLGFIVSRYSIKKVQYKILVSNRVFCGFHRSDRSKVSANVVDILPLCKYYVIIKC